MVDRGVKDALAVENEGELGPVDAVVAGLVIPNSPGNFMPVVGATLPSGAFPICSAVEGVFAVKGCALVAPPAAVTLTDWAIESGNSKPPDEEFIGGGALDGSPNPAMVGPLIGVGSDESAPVGRLYPPEGVEPPDGTPGAGYDDGIA